MVWVFFKEWFGPKKSLQMNLFAFTLSMLVFVHTSNILVIQTVVFIVGLIELMTHTITVYSLSGSLFYYFCWNS